jgi:mannosyltransferase OCH1-like enzyme
MKVTHQIWLGEEIPNIFLEYRQMWLDRFPNYKHIFHRNNDLRDLIQDYYNEYLELYDSFELNIERIDFFRCAMLHHYGGIYIDLDVLPLREFENLLELNCVVLGFEPEEHMKHWNHKHQIIGNAFMISPPKDPFWLNLMKYIKKNYLKGRGPVHNTGPICLSNFFIEHPEKFKNVRIEPANSFYPITNKDGEKTEIFEGVKYNYISKNCQMSKAYVVHLWSGSWGKEVSGKNNITSSSVFWLFIYIFLALMIFISISVVIVQHDKKN